MNKNNMLKPTNREDDKAEIQLKEIIEESHNEPKKW